jgi:hypothetical protein
MRKIELADWFKAVIACVVLPGPFIAVSVWEDHEFNGMSPAEHLAMAQNELNAKTPDLRLARRHLTAIAANAIQSREANTLIEVVDAEQAKSDQKNQEIAQFRAYRANAIKQFVNDLKERGYDLRLRLLLIRQRN